ncbi:MAG TPA: DHA2 family efflux MFS transporter permease subunit [Terriglobia bacterium]|nr:DHA2 family efflux MFS transporter permease subunit [Terriglobia bacterium]
MAEHRVSGKHNPWLIAAVVSIATFMEVLDTTIANVALRHIAGGLAAGLDQATWVVTSYLVANAVILSISGWLSTIIGRKRFYMICVGLFTVSSLLCGLAWSLPALVAFRVLQGLGGGGMAPSEQAILADAFPPHLRGRAFAIYGVAVVVAPVIGPTLGGWITDNYSWHWVFLINVPMGVLSLALVNLLVSEPATARRDREQILRRGISVDYVGFVLVALALGCLEVVLDEGQRNDWFESSFILAFALVSGISFILLVPWELMRPDPIVDIRLLGRRQFGGCFAVMLCVGAILVATTQFLPQMLQEEFGYTATLAGSALSPGGFVTMLLMPISGRLVTAVAPKYLIAAGMAVIAFAMWYVTGLNGDLTWSYAAWCRVFLAIGLPFVFIPITTASYEGLPRGKTNQASALINVARNLGGSMGVSMAQTALAQREQFHQSRLVENVIPSDMRYQEAFKQIGRSFQTQGSASADITGQTTAWIGQLIQKQAALLSYIDVFWLLSMVALGGLAVALVLMGTPMHTRKQRAPAG